MNLGTYLLITGLILLIARILHRNLPRTRPVNLAQRIDHARATVRRMEDKAADSQRALKAARRALAHAVQDAAKAGLATPEAQAEEEASVVKSSGVAARAEALQLQRADYAEAVAEEYPHRWLGCPERFAKKSLSELWRAAGLCIACGVRPVRSSWAAHCYETCEPRQRHSFWAKPVSDTPPPPLRGRPPSRAEAIALVQLGEEQARRNGEARKWPECSSCGEIFRRRTTRRHCLRCRPPGSSGIRVHLPALIAQQGGLCGICGESLSVDLEGIHVDHIVPRAHGGTDAPENLQAAHAVCNLRKGAKQPGERY